MNAISPLLRVREARLPAIVEPFQQATRWDAASKIDMLRLATILRSMRGLPAAVLVAAMSRTRVMQPPLLYRIPAWIATMRGVNEGQFWLAVFTHPKHGEKLTRSVIEDTARWAVSGHDREDERSAGGFSQREVNFIANVINIIEQEG